MNTCPSCGYTKTDCATLKCLNDAVVILTDINGKPYGLCGHCYRLQEDRNRNGAVKIPAGRWERVP